MLSTGLRFLALSAALVSANIFDPLSKGASSKSIQAIDSFLPSGFKDALNFTVNGMKNLLAPAGIEEMIANHTMAIEKGLIGPTVRFYLYADPSDPNHMEELFTGDMETLRKSHYDPTKPTKFLLHGYLEPSRLRVGFPWTTKDAYFASGHDYNVIIVDYTRTTGWITYVLAISLGQLETAAQGADFIEWLYRNNLIDPDQIHIVGISLGAENGAAIAATVKQRLGRPIARLTGLDPAGPGFFPQILATHVFNKDDAKYVDAIHSNSFLIGFGIQRSVGQVDYYMNGGMRQPFCIEELCSHVSSFFFFEDTIRKRATGKRCACTESPMSINSLRICCDTLVNFGEYNNGTTGVYYMPYHLMEILPTVVTDLATGVVNATAT